jgi:hypothetical protein
VVETAVAIVDLAVADVDAEVADRAPAAVAVVVPAAVAEIAADGKYQQEQERATVRRGFRFL